MKLMFFDDFKLGVLKGDAVVDVSAVVKDIAHTGPHDLISGVIERFDDYRPTTRGGRARAARACRSPSVRIRPPLPRPINIDCMAVNYMEDGTRTEPAPINAFHKSPNAIDRPRRHDGAAGRAGHASSRARPRSRWSSASGRRTSRPPRPWTTSSATSISSTARRAACRRPATLLSDEVARHVRADRPVPRHRRRDRRSAQAAGAALEQRHAEAELQHRRHGPQDPALHRVGQLDPHARARRHPGHRHQPPRAATPSRTATRSSSRATASAGCASTCATSSSAPGRARRASTGEQGRQEGTTPQLTGKYAAPRS